jgi:YD repeat-containing protein
MSGASAAYSWYADGLLKQVDYGAGMKREYTYDDADRLKQVTNTVGTEPSTQTQQFIYGYDSNSNRESETRKVNGQTTRGVA